MYDNDVAVRLKQLDELKMLNSPTPEDWKSLSEAKAKCDELARECLAFMQGALLRKARFDDNICAIADRMLDHLSDLSGVDWERGLSVPADSAFMTDLAQIIRLRAADVSIWNLPAAAHEFGHFVGPRLVADDNEFLFPQLQPKQRLVSKTWSYDHEYFADIYATYAIGPCFPTACIVSLFNPACADAQRETHPSDADRIYLMLRTLEQIDDDALVPVFGKLRPYLESQWRETLEEAGKSAEHLPADIARLEKIFFSVYRTLADHFPNLRYNGMYRALSVRDFLLKGAGPVPAETSIADVLNGAWLFRIHNPFADKASLQLRGNAAQTLAQSASG